MACRQNEQVLLGARPVGDIKPEDFAYTAAAMPAPAEGEVLIQVQYLAFDPAMKGWMENRVDYLAPLQVGDVMRGQGSGSEKCAWLLDELGFDAAIDYKSEHVEAHLASGELRSHETVLTGLDRLPEALGLFRGSNLGKQLVALEA
ncbi:MAG: hypothetical protein KDI09_11250 [Halioglobus sp.]|nr:hypothetical protein [Halioglobus sp.]